MSMSSGFDTTEIIPYLIGTFITLALIKWLFSKNQKRGLNCNFKTKPNLYAGKVEDRPIHSPSLYFSYNPDRESVNQLQSMFPTIPRAYIVRELDRCDGRVQAAVDRLVLLAPDFMGFRDGGSANAGHGNVESIDTSPAITSAPSTHYNLLNALNASEGAKCAADGDSVNLTKKNWDKVDTETRQRILLGRKREMLVKAREIFNNK